MVLKLKDIQKSDVIKDVIGEKIKDVILEKISLLKEKSFNENEVNALSDNPFCELNKLRLDVAPVDIIHHSNFKGLKHTKKFIANGNYVFQIIGAGAATRLNSSPIFLTDIFELAPKSQINKFGNSKFKLNLGERQFFQYRTFFESLSKELGMNTQEVLGNQKFIVHLNDNSYLEIIKVFKRNEFFGFDKDNFLFIIQETFPAFRYDGNELFENEDETTYPYGHGYTLLQLKIPGIIKQVNDNGDLISVEDSTFDILKKQGGKVIGAHRINDLTKITSKAVPISRIHYALHKIKKGHNVVVELVGNPNNQKGGKWLKWKGNDELNHSFLIETLNAKSKDWQEAFLNIEEKYFEENKKGIPYNAFRQIYNIENIEELLKGGFPASIRERTQGFTLELTSGDLTQNPDANAIGFMYKDELINDFKSLEDLERAIETIHIQEKNEMFVKIVKDHFNNL